MPTIEVIDPMHVTIDGEHAGSVLDVPANHAGVEGIRSLVMDGLTAWAARLEAEHQADLATLQAEHAAALAARDAEHQADLAGRDATLATLKAELVAEQAHVEALGGTELAQQIAREARRAELVAARTAADEELAKL